MRKDADSAYMLMALDLARRGRGHTRPNPPVGAVVVKDGEVIGRGWHKKAGTDHAEVAAIKNALRHCSEKGALEGAEIYVTLEPCSKPGRVGACTDAITRAGIRRVVFGAVDPNPTNRGRAKRVLAKAGIACAQIAKGEARELCERLIEPFAKHVLTGLPFVTVKIAMSLDGRICDDFGEARWISSAAARRRTGEMREWVDAIMVGAETVRKDNPSLLSHGRRNDDLVRVVVTRSGDLPSASNVFTDGAVNDTVVLTVGKGGLREALQSLGGRGIMHVLCEGGLKLATSLAEEGLVDEWITVLSPCVVGRRRIGEKRTFTFAGLDAALPAADGDNILKYRCLPD